MSGEAAMLMLLFYIDDDRYVLESKQVVEVVPLVALKRLPHAPESIAGVFNYHGQSVPVVDLRSLIQGQPCRRHLSTRIILVKPVTASPKTRELPLPAPSPAIPQLLGLLAERVVETITKSAADFVDAGVQVEAAPYLGKMILDEQGMMQCLQVEHLLPELQQVDLVVGSTP